MLSLSVCAVTGVILALVLKSTGSSMGTFVSVVLCVGTAMLVFNGLISVYTRINMIKGKLGINAVLSLYPCIQESICLRPVLIRNI